MTARKRTRAKVPAAATGARRAKPPGLPAAAGETHEAAAATPPGFPIVGIGASAGGLAAFEAFFSGMPVGTDPDMAFVLVQHLAPDHKSILTDLVRRYTRLQVFEVEDGMTVRANCAYIIPPNRDMALLRGTLQLIEPSAPRGHRLPIDFFFRSLAQDQRERAICVVLSGTGSDGALGVRAIKGEGGMAMAQDPASTEYDGMPRSAIATGLIDYELPPAEMPGQLMAYVAQAFGKLPPVIPAPAPTVESAMRKVFVLLRSQTGHDFSQYKLSTIQRRIERRMAVHQIPSMDRYVEYLQQAPAEVDALFHDFLIGVTSFFRDPQAFEAIQERVIPQLFADRPADAAIRVWSPGCSTGEEAYALAILLEEQREALKQDRRIQVFATDIDSQAIVTARAGVYPASVGADITDERRARFFVAEADGSAYRVHKRIRDMVIFSDQDVIRDPPFSRLDLICCRNLLIYLDGDLQKKLIRLFHYALNPAGYLFLGASETVGEGGHLFATLDRKLKVYQRVQDPHGGHRPAPHRYLPSLTMVDTLAQPAGAAAGQRRRSLREVAEQALLQDVAPAAALVNGQGDILYLHGRTGLYLEPAPGETGISNILRMAREGLQRPLTLALRRVAGTGEPVNHDGVRVRTNGAHAAVNLGVRRVATDVNAPAQGPLYLVVLQDAPAPPTPAAAPRGAETPAPVGSNDDSRIAQLKQELQNRDEYLRTANEELETTNEELKSSNEEMQSINEELQSTNEELETSKEELQSVNEELATVNSELQTKVADLTRANNDMNNLLAGTGIGTVFVDRRLRILRFTPSATGIINLIPSDVGRPVGHIVSNLVGYNRLVEDLQEVLDTLAPREAELQTLAGRWYSMRIRPYRTLDNVIEGAVISFVDVTAMKQAQDALRLHEERMLVALRAVPVVVFNQDRDLRYTWVYGPDSWSTPGRALGRCDTDLLPAEEAAAMTAIKRGVLERGVGTRRVVRTTIDGKPRARELTVEPLRGPDGDIVGITGSLLDVTTDRTQILPEQE